MPRELRYRVPSERLRKLGRSADWKVYRTERLLAWLLLVLLLVVFWVQYNHGEIINRWMERAGVPFANELGNIFGNIVFIGFGFLGIRLLLRHRIRKLERHVDLDQDIHLIEDEGDLRFASPEVEYYLKWHGINLVGLGEQHTGPFEITPLFLNPFKYPRLYLRGISRISKNRRFHRSRQ